MFNSRWVLGGSDGSSQVVGEGKSVAWVCSDTSGCWKWLGEDLDEPEGITKGRDGLSEDAACSVLERDLMQYFTQL